MFFSDELILGRLNFQPDDFLLFFFFFPMPSCRTFSAPPVQYASTLRRCGLLFPLECRCCDSGADPAVLLPIPNSALLCARRSVSALFSPPSLPGCVRCRQDLFPRFGLLLLAMSHPASGPHLSRALASPPEKRPVSLFSRDRRLPIRLIVLFSASSRDDRLEPLGGMNSFFSPVSFTFDLEFPERRRTIGSSFSPAVTIFVGCNTARCPFVDLTLFLSSALICPPPSPIFHPATGPRRTALPNRCQRAPCRDDLP